MLIAPSSYCALSATSANTIKGRAPTIQNNRLGFEVNGKKYSEAIGNIDSAVAKAFDAGLSFSHFSVTDLTNSDYYDVDGDDAHPTAPFTTGAKRIKWYDSNGTEITDMNNTLGCGNNYRLPLKLRIEMTDVGAHSKYGDPKDSLPTNLTKEYLISTTSGICFVRPGSVNYRGGVSRDPISGGGYTADFVPNKGFKAYPTVSTTKFPTTGFPEARFQLVMSGSQTDYTYKVLPDPNSAVSVDANGWVKLKSKPTSGITIRVRTKTTPSTSFDYKFNPRKLWLVPKLKGTLGYNYAEAKTLCGSESKIATRAQLTNSPQNTATPANLVSGSNYFTRAIGELVTDGNIVGESITGEWGLVRNGTYEYPSSDWRGSTYWTKESYSSEHQFVVDVGLGGKVSYFSKATNSRKYVACRG
ncbi:hypothetical protein RCS94_10445 [Orbaceae bacterium ac157xtp]